MNRSKSLYPSEKSSLKNSDQLQERKTFSSGCSTGKKWDLLIERQTHSETEVLPFFDLGTFPDWQLQFEGKIMRLRSKVQHNICCFTDCWSYSSKLETEEGVGISDQ